MDLLPAVYSVDASFHYADLLITSRQEDATDVLGPTRLDDRWQARERTGFTVADFQINRSSQEVVHPQGHTSLSWTPVVDKRTNAIVMIKSSARDCGHCLSRDRCTGPLRRALTIRADAVCHAPQQARKRFGTRIYAHGSTYHRAGSERRSRADCAAADYGKHINSASLQ